MPKVRDHGAERPCLERLLGTDAARPTHGARRDLGHLSQWHRPVPARVALRNCRRSWLTGDLLAAVTVAVYLVPRRSWRTRVRQVCPPVAGPPVHRRNSPPLFAHAGDLRRRALTAVDGPRRELARRDVVLVSPL